MTTSSGYIADADSAAPAPRVLFSPLVFAFLGCLGWVLVALSPARSNGSSLEIAISLACIILGILCPLIALIQSISLLTGQRRRAESVIAIAVSTPLLLLASWAVFGA